MRRDYVNGWLVSTVEMLSPDHWFKYETIIVPVDETNEVLSWHDEYMDRYETEETAMNGHDRGIRWAKNHDHDEGYLIEEEGI